MLEALCGVDLEERDRIREELYHFKRMKRRNGPKA